MKPSLDVRAADPYALTIERHLRELESKGGPELRIVGSGDAVCVAFGESMATAESYEIALVRLAGEILKDDEQRCAMTEALRDVISGGNGPGRSRQN